MMKRNFLLGRGERLTSPVVVRPGPPNKEPPYTFAQARARLSPMLAETVTALKSIPDAACPDGQVVSAITLNPEYIAKSAYPGNLLKVVGLEAIGSRPRRIKPDAKSKNRAPEETLTTELFVRGDKATFDAWAEALPLWSEAARGAAELAALETISAPSPKEKIKGSLAQGFIVMEAVLHAGEVEGESSTLPNFKAYLQQLEIHASLEHRFYAGGLCFVEIEAAAEDAEAIATFTAVRALRQMPLLRLLRPTIRSGGGPAQSVTLPKEGAVAPNIRAAIFDGGLPPEHPLTRWATPLEPTGISEAEEEYLEHGTGVTSAFLFGHIDPRQDLTAPYCNVDHYRVLDAAPGQDPRELYEVLGRIQTTLTDTHYDLVNLSLGPVLPIDDDDVHAWTAVLDALLSSGDTLATVAVGNTGEGDALAGLNRVQVPADCVNALAVGACDSPGAGWARAPYSSIGPGRSPGLIKPDLVEFGGSVERPFLTVGLGDTPTLAPTGGTSFAAPSTLRLGAGVKAHFGDGMDMLAIRALLIHQAESSDQPTSEVGRGRVARDLEQLVLCDDDTVRVVYQGRISPAKYVRAPIPLPSEPLEGMVRMRATLCYVTDTDPHHPGNYTRAGLEPTFRPHSGIRKKSDQVHADTKSFFGPSRKGLTETELRRDAWKWENTIHGEIQMRGSSLFEPAFDIHYNSRLESHAHNHSTELRYALVVTVQAKKVADLYDRVLRRFAAQLEPLRPVIDIPVRTSG
jgi:hypothetical protein